MSPGRYDLFDQLDKHQQKKPEQKAAPKKKEVKAPTLPKLTQSIIVDQEDEERIYKHAWRKRNDGVLFTKINGNITNTLGKYILLVNEDSLIVRHKNGNTLDARKDNLEVDLKSKITIRKSNGNSQGVRFSWGGKRHEVIYQDKETAEKMIPVIKQHLIDGKPVEDLTGGWDEKNITNHYDTMGRGVGQQCIDRLQQESNGTATAGNKDGNI